MEVLDLSPGAARAGVQQMRWPINRLRRPAAARTTARQMPVKPKAPSIPPPPRTAYLVLGMHRSGTSAVTQLLALAGAALPANVMPGDEHNAKGYFEPWKIAIFNDERLRAAGSAWDDPFAYPFRPLPSDEEALWRDRAAALFDAEFGAARFPLLKDPRVSVLLPAWRQVLEARQVAARCVIPVRHPLAVAGSLARRDGFPPEKSVLVWSAYMLASEAYSRDLPTAVVSYDALLADWRTEAARIAAAHGAPLPKLTETAGRRIDRFLSPTLCHNAADAGLAELGWAGAIAQDVLSWFNARAADAPADRGLLERAAAELARRQAEMGPLFASMTRELAAARAELRQARDDVAAAQILANDIQANMDRDRALLDGAFHKLQTIADARAEALGRINHELDAALSDD
jgi:hypothetical protein